jgi:hypothetical protein
LYNIFYILHYDIWRVVWPFWRKGLRQEDHLSPYLFVFSIGILSCLLNDAVKNGLLAYHPRGKCWDPKLASACEGCSRLRMKNDTWMSNERVKQRWFMAKRKLIMGKWRKDKHKVNDETNKRMAVLRIWAVICPVSHISKF